MINKNILSKKGIYLKSIENNSSLKTFRFRKIKLASINKTILIPKINRNSLKSTTYNSDLSLDNIVPQKFEIKINKFNALENLNTMNKIESNRKRIEPKFISNKSHNNIFQNIKNLTPLKIKPDQIIINSSSYRKNNSFSQNKPENKRNSSLLIPLHIKDVLYLSKTKNNPINKELDGCQITLEKKEEQKIELKSIFQNNNNKIKDITNKINTENRIILKSKILTKKNKAKNEHYHLKQKNKNFLKFIINNNNKELLEKIDKIKRYNIKNNQTTSTKIKIEKEKDEKNKVINESKLIKYFISLKRLIFNKNKVSTKILIYNSMKNTNIFLFQSEVQVIINRNIIQYFSSKYNVQKYLSSYIGISKIKEKKSIPSYVKKYILRKDVLLPNVENEINSNIIYKNNVDKINQIKKFSVISKQELKRNTQSNSKNFLSRYSLLGNSEFFSNTKKEKKTKQINNTERRKSFFIRNMYTNLNRRKSLPIKQILKKEDFLKLKSLIESKKENQFEFELHKLINIYDINSSDKHGNTLLTYACMNSEIYIVKYLLNNGANPNCINKYKNTPLHYALSNKNYMIADLLIQNKAKDNLKNIFGLTPW